MKNTERENERNTQKIRLLNDVHRLGLGCGDGTVITASLTTLPSEELALVMAKVRNFTDFTPDNDPYGEHDFGAFTHNGKRFMWKIDYYDMDLKYGSENPADPSITKRMLTVMLASDY